MLEGGEEKLVVAEGETKIAMDQYYMDEYDQYAEGNYVVILCGYSLVFTCFRQRLA